MSDNEFFGGRRRRRGNGGDAFSPYTLFASGEQGVWYDPSDLTPEKVSWRRNLLTYSQDFENAAWNKLNASILSNLMLYSQEFGTSPWVTTGSVTSNTTTAPDGTTTADTLSFPVANNTTYQQSAAAIAGVTYTMSVWLRADSAGTIRIAFANDGTKGVDVSVTTSWTRFTYTNTTTGSNDGMQIRRDSAGHLSAVYAWGAQLVPGSTAQTYTRSLATAAPIQFADPLGGTLADKLVENTANARHELYLTLPIATSFAGSVYTATLYIKAAERRYFTVLLKNASGASPRYSATFDSIAGTVTATDSSGSPGSVANSITDAGNGWWRVRISMLFVSQVVNFEIGLSDSATPSYSESMASYTGDGVSGIYVYGAQVEQASTASAYQRITDFNSDFLAAFPTHALYQDSVGGTPVTALGQSVGLVVDKRLGGMAALGPELWASQTPNIQNLAGSNGVWDASTLTMSNTSVGTDIGYPRFGFSVGIVSGRTYCVTGRATVENGSIVQIRLALSGASNNVTFNATTGVFFGVVVASGTVMEWIIAGTALSRVRINSISVREVPGNHALQATLAAKPTLQARSNLLTYSEQFDNAAWVKTEVTIGANTLSAPDGTTTADRFLASTNNVSHYLQNNITVAGGCTGSVYVKLDGSGVDKVTLYPGGAATFAHFNLTNLTTTREANCSASSIVDAGNGWYRCIATWPSSITADRLRIYASSGATGDAPFAGSGTTGPYLWGAQLEQASTASTYQRVVTATDYADVGLPRNLTFDGVDDSLATAGNVDFATWTVGTRRNLLTNPTQFDASSWTQNNSTVTANTVVAPDGTTTADTVTANAGTGFHYVRLVAGPTLTGTYTYSFYVRKNTSTWIFFTINDSFINYFNLDTGQFGTTPDSCVATDVGGGWYRIAATRTLSATGVSCGIGVANSNGGGSFTAVGTESLYAWGAQLEVGSTATAFQDVGTDKVTLFSGVTKLSDVGRGIVAELGNLAAPTQGMFAFNAPRNAGVADIGFQSFGNSVTSEAVATSLAAPITRVATGIGDIGGAVAQLRLNGVLAASASNAQTGNYGSYLLYIGRRTSSANPFNGRLFQLVIRGAATDSVTVGNAERWVGQLTGVAL